MLWVELLISLPKNSKNHTRLSAGSYAESIGQYNFDVQASTGFKKFGIQTNFQRNFFEGFNNDNSLRFKTWKPRTQYLADLNVSYFIKNGTIRLNNSFLMKKFLIKESQISIRLKLLLWMNIIILED